MATPGISSLNFVHTWSLLSFQGAQSPESPKTPQQKGGDKSPSQKQTPGGGDTKTPKKKVMEGGIIVEELKEGHGPEAKRGKNVKVNYIGRLTNGKVFDSSKQKPFGFKLGMNEVIKGWDTGVAGEGHQMHLSEVLNSHWWLVPPDRYESGRPTKADHSSQICVSVRRFLSYYAKIQSVQQGFLGIFPRYGSQSLPGIPANSTLVFDVELKAVN